MSPDPRTTSPSIGSRWRERDKRSRHRVVEVVQCNPNWITVRTVVDWRGRTTTEGRKTTIRPELFRVRWVPAIEEMEAK